MWTHQSGGLQRPAETQAKQDLTWPRTVQGCFFLGGTFELTDEQAEGEGCGFQTKGKISAEMRLYQRAQASIEMNGWTTCGIHTWRNMIPPEKEGSSGTGSNRDAPWKGYAKWNKLDTRGQVSCGFTYMKYLGQANSWRQKVDPRLPGLGDERKGSCYLMGTEFPFGRMHILKLASVHGCSTLRMQLIPLNCIL